MARAAWAVTVLLLAVLPASCVSGGLTSGRSLVLQRLGEPVFAGWSLTTPEAVTSAAALGLTVDILYNPPPLPDSPLGRALTRMHVRVVSAEISTWLQELECRRTQTVAPPPPDNSPFCTDDPGQNLDDLIDAVRRIVRRDAANPLVAGYWILDDVAAWDVGGMREALSKIRNIVPADQPTICGFSAGLGVRGRGEWDGRIAANFSPASCDAVALYIYAQPQPPGTPSPSIDWSMGDLLPRILHSLGEHGWDAAGQPLIGVAQAWSGHHSADGKIVQRPSRVDILTQARAFCQAGAIGIAWYSWELSDYPGAVTPETNPEMADGIRAATRRSFCQSS